MKAMLFVFLPRTNKYVDVHDKDAIYHHRQKALKISMSGDLQGKIVLQHRI